MKRNALIRIILYSAAIVVLSGILLYVMLGVYGRRTDIVEASMAPAQLVEDTNSVSLSATVSKKTNVYSAPSTDATRVGVLHPGVTAEIDRQETVGGVLWSYIVQPTAGWIPNLDGEIIYHRKEDLGYEEETAIVEDALNIRATPSSEGTIVGMLEDGETIVLGRRELINGESWAYVLTPIQGWIQTGHVSFPTEPVEESTWQEGDIAIVDSDLNVRSSPSTLSTAIGMLEAGTHITLGAREVVNGESWAYVLTPVQGWIVTKYVSFPSEPVSETVGQATAATEMTEPLDILHGNAVSFEPSQIQDLEIEWAAGSIVIQPRNIDKIAIMEENLHADQDPMVWKERNGKLTIAFSRNTDLSLGLGMILGEDHKKDLVIQVPYNWICRSLEIDAASASVEVTDMTIQEVEFDGASGTCVFENCKVDSLDVDTASGDVTFTGSLEELDCDAASAKVNLDLKNVPRQLDMDTASGDLTIVLPEDAGFTVSINGMSSRFESDFTTVNRNGSYYHGNGSCEINVDAMSGDVNIFKGPPSNS